MTYLNKISHFIRHLGNFSIKTTSHTIGKGRDKIQEKMVSRKHGVESRKAKGDRDKMYTSWRNDQKIRISQVRNWIV